MNVIEGLKWRYATKKFDNGSTISESDIDILCDAFNLTATSYGLQPIKMYVVKDKAIQMKLQNAAMNQAQVGSASHILVICIESTVDATFIDNYFELFPEKNKGILAYKDIIQDRFSGQSAENIEQWAVNQAYIALGNLMTVCASMKIDACPMEGFVPSEVDEILNLGQEGVSSVLLLPIGYRDENDKSAVRSKVRRPINEIIKKIY